MTVETVTEIIRSALYTIIITSTPMLLVSLVLGLIISIFQTVTSIQEQTLTFVPKLLGIFVVLMITGHWMLGKMVTLLEELWNFAIYIR